MPGLVLALVTLFPKSNFGLELACVLMIFTAQVWNMVFSYYDALKAVPGEFRQMGDSLRVRRLFNVSSGSSCPLRRKD